MCRVLKPAGKLVVTTPNVLHINSRLSHFLTGQRVLRRGLVNEVQAIRGIKDGKLYHGHAFLIDYFRLRYPLALSGFRRIEVFTDRYSPSSVALVWVIPILFAASKLSVRMSIRKSRKKGQNLPHISIFREILSMFFLQYCFLVKG